MTIFSTLTKNRNCIYNQIFILNVIIFFDFQIRYAALAFMDRIAQNVPFHHMDLNVNPYVSV